MTLAEQAIERMKARSISAAQAANDLQDASSIVDEVDGIFKFYHFPDGSKLGVRFREAEHFARWPREFQQVWVCKPIYVEMSDGT